MNQHRFFVTFVAALGFAGSASADAGINLSGGVHAASDFNFRGQSLTGNAPTMGFDVSLSGLGGFYATLGEDTVDLRSTTGGAQQFLTSVTAGYGTNIGAFSLGAGVTKYIFSGPAHVSDLSFGEAFVTAGWNGLCATIYRNIDGAKGDPARLAKGDTFASLGYSHSFGKFSIGADAGYYRYDKGNNPAAQNGLAVANLHGGYAVNEHMNLGIVYQAAGKNPNGSSQERNNTALVSFGYRF